MNIESRHPGALIVSRPSFAKRKVRHDCRGVALGHDEPVVLTDAERVKTLLSLKFQGLLAPSLPIALRERDKGNALVSEKTDWKVPLGLTVRAVDADAKAIGRIEWLETKCIDFDGLLDKPSVVEAVPTLTELACVAFSLVDATLRAVGFRLAEMELAFGMVNGTGMVITSLFNLDTLKVVTDEQVIGSYLADEGLLLNAVCDCSLRGAAA